MQLDDNWKQRQKFQNEKAITDSPDENPLLRLSQKAIDPKQVTIQDGLAEAGRLGA